MIFSSVVSLYTSLGHSPARVMAVLVRNTTDLVKFVRSVADIKLLVSVVLLRTFYYTISGKVERVQVRSLITM